MIQFFKGMMGSENYESSHENVTFVSRQRKKISGAQLVVHQNYHRNFLHILPSPPFYFVYLL